MINELTSGLQKEDGFSATMNKEDSWTRINSSNSSNAKLTNNSYKTSNFGHLLPGIENYKHDNNNKANSEEKSQVLKKFRKQMEYLKAREEKHFAKLRPLIENDVIAMGYLLYCY